MLVNSHAWSLVVIRGHSCSLMVIRGHSCVLLDTVILFGEANSARIFYYLKTAKNF